VLSRGSCPHPKVLKDDGTVGEWCYYHEKLFAGYGTPFYPEAYLMTKDGKYAPRPAPMERKAS
jgi:hypothetical protein